MEVPTPTIDKKQLAHITNEFAQNAQIGFSSARQLCLFLLLISQTDPFNEEDKMSGVIGLSDIGKLVRKENAKRSGSIHQEVLAFVDNMMESNFIRFHTSIVWKGQQLPKYIAIFDVLEPIEIPEGNIMYRYQFNDMMRPHIKGFLKDFVTMPIPKGIKSGHAVRFLIMAKSYRDKQKAYSKVTCMKVELESLKRILGISGKYEEFKNFRRRVIEPIYKGVNESKILLIEKYDYIKTGKKVTHIAFYLKDGELTPQAIKNLESFRPSSEDLSQLTRSQTQAFDFLVNKSFNEGIIYKQIIKKMPSSEYLGWEDIFVEKAWERFEKVTTHKRADYKAGAFIKWWTAGEFKDRLFSEVMEAVQQEKKSKTDVELFNRNLAKSMTNIEFIKKIKQKS